MGPSPLGWDDEQITSASDLTLIMPLVKQKMQLGYTFVENFPKRKERRRAADRAQISFSRLFLSSTRWIGRLVRCNEISDRLFSNCRTDLSPCLARRWLAARFRSGWNTSSMYGGNDRPMISLNRDEAARISNADARRCRLDFVPRVASEPDHAAFTVLC
jgi:hypothetical protein